jgi:hypothetical protein
MNILERYFLERLFRKQVKQGAHHDARIRELYTMIRLAAEEEFTEDNTDILNEFLTRQFYNSLRECE